MASVILLLEHGEHPVGHDGPARRFGCYEKEGLDRFLADMRRAQELMGSLAPAEATRPADVADFVMLSNRLLAVALRARLWYEYVWDTSYRGHDEPYLAACRTRAEMRQEYLERGKRDREWYRRRWSEDNLESEWSACDEMLQAAMRSIERIVTSDGEIG